MSSINLEGFNGVESRIEALSDHIRANIIGYLIQNHNIEALDDNAEREIYEFILTTIQTYISDRQTMLNTKRLGWYMAFTIAILAYYCFLSYAAV